MINRKSVSEIFTYGDYCQWSDGERWELIHGTAYAMTAPSRIHQKVVLELGRQISNFLQGKPCEPYIAPFDVRLPQKNEVDEEINTVVQPDISVICDPQKLDDKGCRGAPDWIIEILSPSTAFKDMDTKRTLYESHGVREYWLIHPIELWGMVYLLNNEGFYGVPHMFQLENETKVSIFPELQINWQFLS
ncbi:Uma2 family endonuclease [Beggiatoa alba]|nr:Uma2 family endonuclease [Beggiatoa alba]